MPKAVVHQVGAALSVGAFLFKDEYDARKQSLKPLVGALVAGWAGTLPDQIEPATHPNHRGPAHSAAVLALAAWSLKELLAWKPETESEDWVRVIAIGLVGGYATHLVMDGVTPKSLPLFR